MNNKGMNIMKYKNTLLIPKTDLPMRGDLLNKEPQVQEMWDTDEQYRKASHVYRKIRSTLRFILGNINDFNPETDSIAETNLLEVDRYLLNRLREFTASMINNYNDSDYLNIYQEVQKFINVELSNFYLDYGKDILHNEKKDSHKRRSMQTVLYQILIDMTKLLAPILVHTAEEVWSHTPHVKEESVLSDMPKVVDVDEELLEKWNTFMNLCDDVNHALEQARNEKVIGKSLEAKVVIGNNESFNTAAFLQQFNDLQQLFIVSQVEVKDKMNDGVSYQYGYILIKHAEGEKCERCWNYTEELGSVGEFDHLCPRCQEVVKLLI